MTGVVMPPEYIIVKSQKIKAEVLGKDYLINADG